MKHKLLAVAIPALLAAGAANAAVELFNKDGNTLSVDGRVAAKYYLTVLDKDSKRVANGVDDKGNSNGKKGDASYARVGFTGTTTITDELKAFARIDTQIESNGDGFKTRDSYVGLDFGTYGKLSYGRMSGVLSNVTDFTDVLPEFGGKAVVGLKNRTNNLVTYTNQGFYGLVDGLDVALQYQANTETQTDAYSRSYGLAATYSILDTGIRVGAGIAHSLYQGKIVDGVKGNDGYNFSYTTAISYEGYGAYVAALFSHKFDKKEKNQDGRIHDFTFELVAKYTHDFAVGSITPSIAYIQYDAKNNNDKNNKINKTETQYVDLGVEYAFTKNVSAFVDYKINLLSKTKNPNDYKNTAALGFTYKF